MRVLKRVILLVVAAFLYFFLYGWLYEVAAGDSSSTRVILMACVVTGALVLTWRRPIGKRMTASFVYCLICATIMSAASSVAFFRWVAATARTAARPR